MECSKQLAESRARKVILVIDNYDSFVHNLARYFERLSVRTKVVRNDATTVREIEQMQPTAVVLSPGPCTPDEAGVSLELVRQLHTSVPMLGVCLGHQTIAQALGGRVVRGDIPWHGRASEITHDGAGLFRDVPSPLAVGRYHSLVVDPPSLPEPLKATAWADEATTLMSFAHTNLPVLGVQFHPESILTQHGYRLVNNFLAMAGVTHLPDPSELSATELPSPSAPPNIPTQPITF